MADGKENGQAEAVKGAGMSVTTAHEFIVTVNIKREPDETWPVLECGKTRYRMDELETGVRVTFSDPAHPVYDVGPVWVRIGYRLRANGTTGARIGEAHTVYGDDHTEINRFRLECELVAHATARRVLRDFLAGQMRALDDSEPVPEHASWITDRGKPS